MSEDRPAADRGLLSVIGLFGAATAIGLTADAYPAAAALLGLGVFLPVPYAVAVGHVLLAALYPDGVSLTALAAVEAGLLASLADAGATRFRVRDALVAVVGAGAVAGIVGATVRYGDSLWSSVATLSVLFALCSYGLHRYQLVQFAATEVER